MSRFFNQLSAGRMQSRDLLQLAGLLALNGQEVIQSGCGLTDRNLQNFWSASRCRLDRWGRFLRALTTAAGQGARQTESAAVFEEIITSEVLARVWTACVHASDRDHDPSDSHDNDHGDAPAVTLSLMKGHLEARHRAMGMLATDKVDDRDARRLARLCRRVARWTDLLIAHLQQNHEVRRFAADSQRAVDFADDLRHRNNHSDGQDHGPLTLASMRQAICHGLSASSPNADLNYQIGATIVSSCDSVALQSSELFDSLWAIRMLNTSSQCESMLAEVLAIP